MAEAGGGAGTKKPKKMFGKKFKKSPAVLASAHGAYYITADTAPFTVPPNIYIIETQTIGDYCLTNIDQTVFRLFQGANRPFLTDVLRGREIAAEGKEFIDTFKNLTFYAPGDNIYNRGLSIGGGRGSGPGGGGSSRIIYAGMGFFFFPADPSTPLNTTFPYGKQTKFLGELRTKMIEDANFIMSYQEFMDYVFKLYPELKSGCVFVFSCCAGSFNMGAKSHEYDTIIHAIETVQQAQRQKLLTQTGVGAGGAIEEENVGKEGAAAAGGGGGAGVAKPPTTSLFGYEMRGSVRSAEPSEFHISAYGENPDAMSSLANTRWASRFVPERERVKINKPKGTKQIFEESDSGKTYKQLFVEGTESPYWTLAEIKAYQAKNPAAKLKELKAGDFVDVALSGGKRRRGTRRTSKSSRKTRKSRR